MQAADTAATADNADNADYVVVLRQDVSPVTAKNR